MEPAPSSDRPTQRGLRRSALAPLFVFLAGRPKYRAWAIRKICGREGGQMTSATFRELMRKYYGVEIGLHSYGPCLQPGALPRGTRVANYCSLAAGIQVFRRNHPGARISQHPYFYNAVLKVIPEDTILRDEENPLAIESDAWVGSNAIITPRCRVIGLGAVVGAGAVVTKDVPPFAIVAGNPARVIGHRFGPDLQAAVTASRWWEHPIDELSPQLRAFCEDASVESVRAVTAALRTPAATR